MAGVSVEGRKSGERLSWPVPAFHTPRGYDAGPRKGSEVVVVHSETEGDFLEPLEPQAVLHLCFRLPCPVGWGISSVEPMQ